MSKNKGVLSRVAAMLVFVAVCFAAVIGAGCNVVTKTLESITVDEAKTQYFIGDEFDGNIKVTAHYALSDETTEDVDVSDKVSVNSKAYKKDTVGDYEIKVSYTEEDGASAETSYKVNVTQKRNGLALSYKEGAGDPVYLSADKTTADISAAASWIEVRQPDELGEVSDNSTIIDPNNYTVKIYKGKEEVKDLSSVKRGAYQIWASRYDKDDDFTYEGFILFYVVDQVMSVTLAEGTTTQERSLKDKMTSSWKFTVTYESGDTATVDKTNMYLDIPKFNSNAGKSGKNYNAKLTVNYNEPLPNGTAQSKSVEVPYTLTGQKAVPDMAVLDPSKLSSATGEVKTEFLTFEIIGNKGSDGTLKSKLASDRGGDVSLPSGLEIEPFNVGQAWQSGGTSSQTAGGYINFRANRNFEIYVYAHSNEKNENERYMIFETEDEYTYLNPVEDYMGFGSDYCVGARGNITAHVQNVTGVSADGVDFTLSFSASINVLYILIVFEEE